MEEEILDEAELQLLKEGVDHLCLLRSEMQQQYARQREDLHAVVQELKLFIHQQFNIPIPSLEIKTSGQRETKLETELPNQPVHDVFEASPNHEVMKKDGVLAKELLESDGVLKQDKKRSHMETIDEPKVEIETADLVAHQVFDEMPGAQGGHRLDVLNVFTTDLPLRDGNQAKDNILTGINTHSLREFRNCIARSRYFESDVKYAGHVARSVSSRYVGDDGVGTLSFDPGGQPSRKLIEHCLDVFSYEGTLLKFDAPIEASCLLLNSTHDTKSLIDKNCSIEGSKFDPEWGIDKNCSIEGGFMINVSAEVWEINGESHTFFSHETKSWEPMEKLFHAAIEIKVEREGKELILSSLTDEKNLDLHVNIIMTCTDIFPRVNFDYWMPTTDYVREFTFDPGVGFYALHELVRKMSFATGARFCTLEVVVLSINAYELWDSLLAKVVIEIENHSTKLLSWLNPLDACVSISLLKFNFTETSCLLILFLEKMEPLISTKYNAEIIIFGPGGVEFMHSNQVIYLSNETEYGQGDVKVELLEVQKDKYTAFLETSEVMQCLGFVPELMPYLAMDEMNQFSHNSSWYFIVLAHPFLLAIVSQLNINFLLMNVKLVQKEFAKSTLISTSYYRGHHVPVSDEDNLGIIALMNLTLLRHYADGLVSGTTVGVRYVIIKADPSGLIKLPRMMTLDYAVHSSLLDLSILLKFNNSQLLLGKLHMSAFHDLVAPTLVVNGYAQWAALCGLITSETGFYSLQQFNYVMSSTMRYFQAAGKHLKMLSRIEDNLYGSKLAEDDRTNQIRLLNSERKRFKPHVTARMTDQTLVFMKNGKASWCTSLSFVLCLVICLVIEGFHSDSCCMLIEIVDSIKVCQLGVDTCNLGISLLRRRSWTDVNGSDVSTLFGSGGKGSTLVDFVMYLSNGSGHGQRDGKAELLEVQEGNFAASIVVGIISTNHPIGLHVKFSDVYKSGTRTSAGFSGSCLSYLVVSPHESYISYEHLGVPACIGLNEIDLPSIVSENCISNFIVLLFDPGGDWSRFSGKAQQFPIFCHAIRSVSRTSREQCSLILEDKDLVQRGVLLQGELEATFILCYFYYFWSTDVISGSCLLLLIKPGSRLCFVKPGSYEFPLGTLAL